MSSTDLTRPDGRSQLVRSYHKAYDGDLMLYELGDDLRLWRPVTARQILWTVGLLVSAFVFSNVLGLQLPFLSMGWALYYFLPFGLGWFFARALIQGCRLHVVLVSWVRHAVYGRNLAGGYARVGRHRQVKGAKVRVESAYRSRASILSWRPSTLRVLPVRNGPRPRRVASARRGLLLAPVALVVVAVSVFSLIVQASSPARTVAQKRVTATRVATVAPAVVPIVPASRPVTPRRKVRHRRQVAKRPARRVERPAAPRPARRTPPRPSSPVRVHTRAQVAPAAAYVAPVRPVPVAPQPLVPSVPSTPSCYPGQPGC